MARNKLSVQGRVRASSIIEVLISMVVIMVVFGLAMMIYTNVVRSSLSVKKIRSEAILHEIMENDEKAGDVSSQTINTDVFRIEQEVKPYAPESGLIEISITAYDANGQQTAALHKVIIQKND